MTGKQKALTGLMAGAFGLRWLAGQDLPAAEPLVRSALLTFDTMLGWGLAVGLVLLLGAGLGRARTRLSSDRCGNE
ncbi:hypothetical protein CLV78_10641 [Aliiruegeria haliotis]|uniref:Uncharacterized protein n=1 Tax=Aliiruegeria haliotis TaxID=1280846 RepID=A0A2T0RMY3_9RHOB|nr:hypothetical protein [Aliiruegeria haliotis]PRY22501.1 hypothetical protein CLV78_10641 [Aliiruegeria haliotis]